MEVFVVVTSIRKLACMNKKSLVIMLSLGLFIAGGGGGAWWWYMNQPEQISARAQQYLSEGKGEQAVELLSLLAEQGDQEAISQLAKLYAEGKLVQRDEVAAARYFLQLAELGNEAAQREMAKRYEQGCGVPASAEAAARWLVPFADRGEADANQKLCEFYRSGKVNHPQDAHKRYLAAATAGAADYAFLVAENYAKGVGVEKNLAEAYSWYQKAATAGHEEALRPLADCYAQGIGTERNVAKAAELYKKVISESDAEGLYTLATCYEEAGDFENARAYYASSSKLGHTKAKSRSAVCEYNMAAKTRNYVEAFRQLQTAAEAGDAEAAAYLAHCFRYGLGTEPDSQAAEKWLSVAEKSGVKASIPTPVTPQWESSFDCSGSLSILPNTSHLRLLTDVLAQNEKEKKLNEERENYNYRPEIRLTNSELSGMPVQVRKNIDVSRFRTPWLITDDFIITRTASEAHFDFWDARSLQYFFTLSNVAVELSEIEYGHRESRAYHSYLPDKGVVGMCFRAMIGDSGASQVVGIDLNGLKVTDVLFDEVSQVSMSYMIDGVNPFKPLPKKVFTKEPFAGITSWITYPEYEEDIKKTPVEKYTLEALSVGTALEKENLTIRDIDFNTFRIKPHSKVDKNDATQKKKAPLACEIEGLPDAPYWYVDHADGLSDNVYLYRWGDEDIHMVAYYYDADRKLLLPSLHNDLGRHKYGATGYIGESDCGWISVTDGCHIWVVDQNTGKIYDVVDGSGEKSLVRWQKDGHAHEIFGSLVLPEWKECCFRLSVINKIPGKKDKAYWIASNNKHTGIWEVDLTGKKSKLVKLWTAEDSGYEVSTPIWDNDKQCLFFPINSNAWKVVKLHVDTMQVEDIGYVYLYNDKEFAIITTEGYYAGSPGCERFLYILKDGNQLGMDILAPWRNRPAEVLKKLGGDENEIRILEHTTERWLQKLGFRADSMRDEPQLRDVPSVIVARPAVVMEAEKVSIPIKITADNTQAITDIRIKADGVNIPQKWQQNLYVAPNKELVVQAEVVLVPGVNWIEVTPMNSLGIQGKTERFRVICNKEAKQAKQYVVAIGVSQYQDSTMNLQYASKDAGDIVAAFREFYHGETEVLLLQDKEVTKEATLSKIRQFVASAKEHDKLVVYCAGHGVLDDQMDYYYAPTDFDSDRIKETGIFIDDLLDCIDSTSARQRLLLLDTCHSGLLGEEGEEQMALAMGNLPSGVRAIQHRGMKVKAAETGMNAAFQKRYIEEFFSHQQTRRGLNVLSGSAGAEFALESDELKNGVFTAAVVEILKGNVDADANADGKISIAELYGAVAGRVSQQTAGLQQPSLSYLENEGKQVLGKTLVYYAKNKDWQSVNKLASKGYKVCEKPKKESDYEYTTLILQAMKNKAPISVISSLIKAGAKNNTMLYDAYELCMVGDPPLYTEKEMSGLLERVLPLSVKEDRTRLLMKLCGFIDSPERVQLVDMLLKSELDLDYRDSSGNTLLHVVQKDSIVQQLLKQGADVTALNNEGNTVLFGKKGKKSCDLLLDRGVPINAVNKQGRTALLTAGDFAAASYLIQKGADVTVKDNNGNTVLDHYDSSYKQSMLQYVRRVKGESYIKKLEARKKKVNLIARFGINTLFDNNMTMWDSHFEDLAKQFAPNTVFMNKGKMTRGQIKEYFKQQYHTACKINHEYVHVQPIKAAQDGDKLEFLSHYVHENGKTKKVKHGYVFQVIHLNENGEICVYDEKFDSQKPIPFSKGMKELSIDNVPYDQERQVQGERYTPSES